MQRWKEGLVSVFTFLLDIDFRVFVCFHNIEHSI